MLKRNSSLVLVLRLSRVIGIFPIRSTSSGPLRFAHIQVSVTVFICGILLLITHVIYFTFKTLQSDLFLYKPASTQIQAIANNIIDIFQHLTAIIILSIGSVGGPRRIRAINHILQNNKKIGKSLGYSGQSTEEDLRRYVLVGVCIYNYVALLCETYVYYEHWMNILNFIMYSHLGISNTLMLFQYVLLTYHVLSSLTAINERMQHILTDLPYSDITSLKHEHCYDLIVPGRCIKVKMARSVRRLMSTSTGNQSHQHRRTKNTIIRIRQISSCYVKFCRNVRDLNEIDGSSNLFLVIYIFVSLFLSIFMVIAGINQTAKDNNWISILINECSWIVINIYTLVAFTEPSYKLKVELLRTKSLLAQILCAVDDGARGQELVHELYLLKKQLRYNKPEYHAFGICMINRQFIFTVLSTVLTYSIILF